MKKIALATLALAGLIAAQTKPTLQPKDYGQWENIGGQNAIELSPDGKWLAYQVTRSNRDNELRIVSSGGGQPITIPFGTKAKFSLDSRWIAYSIGLSESQQEKLRKDKKPVRDKLGLTELTAGSKISIDNIQSFAMSPDGKSLAMRRYAPEPPTGAEKKEVETEAPASASLIVRDLASGKDTTFGNVSEYAWQDLPKTGHLLALTVNANSAEDKTGNATQLFDPSLNSIRVLDSSPSNYVGLGWRKKSSDLAVLRAASNDKQDGPTHAALAWTGLGTQNEKSFTFDPAKDQKFPSGMRTVSYRSPSWSDDGATVFVGLAKWNPKPSKPKKDEAGKDAAKQDDDDAPSVDVWHWRDPEVLSLQKTSALQFAHRNMLAAWDIAAGSFVPLGTQLTEQVTPLHRSRFSYAADWNKYALDRSMGRPAIDLYLVDNLTGARTPLGNGIRDDHYLQASPGGKYIIYLQNDHYWTVNTATKQLANITRAVNTSFVDRESDFTQMQKPPFGIAGWTENDAKVILYDKYDMWLVSPDGSGAKKLTDGAKDELRHTYLKLDRDAEFIDTSKPVYLRLFGVRSKKSGFAKLTFNGENTCKEEHLVLEDRMLDHLTKAKEADTFAFLAQSFTQSPNILIASANLSNGKQVTDTNPDQDKYAWSHEELIDYKNSKGERLQGALYYPADYQAGKQYPMVVYIYEKLSDNLHRYDPPSERNYYSIGALLQQGYFVLTPDIVFQAREPGLSVADCVGAALKKVIATGAVDPKRIGVMGHSWGGFDTTFLATHTNLFAAAVAGAPITDLVSNYGNHHWSSGIAETDHIETGQQRMEVPLYEDLQAYIRNSAVFNVQNMTTPLLIEVGDADGTVFYHQGVELYNIARRAKKNVVLIVYNGEDHSLRKKADQIDYHRRLVAWFDHYLKGSTAPSWITEGETYQQHQLDLKISKAAAK